MQYGADVSEHDASWVESFEGLAREAGMDNDAAQKFVDLFNRRQAAFEEQVSEGFQVWLEQAKADKEIGGAQFDEKLSKAAALVRRFGTPELINAFDEYGLGNHPEMIRFCYRLAQHVGEDAIKGTTAPAGPAADDKMAALRSAYPSMFNEDGTQKEF